MARAMMGGVEATLVLPAFVLLVLVALTFVLPWGMAAGFHCPVGARPVIFNFGDSNSDTGGAVKAGSPMFPPAGRTFFGKPAGRATDGRLIIDFLCDSLNTSFLTPYLDDDALGPYFNNGANFAIIAAKVLIEGYEKRNVLQEQVQRFFNFRRRSLDLKSKAPVGVREFQNALYMMDIGQNDLHSLVSLMPYDQVLARIPPIVAEMQKAIQTLYNSEARNFWIHGTGPLGCLPVCLATMNDGADLDENGCLRSLNNAAKALNIALSNMCDRMSLHLKNATIVYTDIFAIKYDLVVNHACYGFEKPFMACCGNGGPPYNFNVKKICLSRRNVLSCKNTSQYISWDGIYLTDSANAVVAKKILSGDYSIPKLIFDEFCRV